MKDYLILLPILFLALVQGTFLPINFVLLLFIFWVVIFLQTTGFPERAENKVYGLAFLAGLIFDLTKGTNLGFSSASFLIIAYLLVVYSRRFDATRPVFLSGFVFAANLLSAGINGRFGWQESLFLALIGLLFGGILSFFSGSSRVIKLKN